MLNSVISGCLHCASLIENENENVHRCTALFNITYLTLAIRKIENPKSNGKQRTCHTRSKKDKQLLLRTPWLEISCRNESRQS